MPRQDVRSPYSGEVVGSVDVASWDDVDAALDRAKAAFVESRKSSAFDRAKVLLAVSAAIRERSEELAKLICDEGGKPLKWARVEVARAASTFQWAGEEARRFSGELLRLDTEATATGRVGIARRFPLGVVFGIAPFNFPLNLVAHKVAPALASGNTIVLKPAMATPLSAVRLGEICAEAGAGDSLAIVPCVNTDAEKAVTDDRVAKVSFTGSTGVGWRLKGLVPKKKVTLELGGNAAVIIEPDADLAHAAERIAFGAFYQAGQSCISVQRVLVQRDVYEAFLAELKPKVEALVTGDPSDDATDVGPLIDSDAADRVEAWVNEAVAAGATVLTGGRRDGRCYAPTILTDTRTDMKVSCMEVFGPVATVEPYDTFDEAIAVANDSEYGLQGGVFTNDITKVFRAHRDLEVGGVIHNDVSAFRADQMPYGGMKDSGFGREGVRYAMDEMSELKILVLSGIDL